MAVKFEGPEKKLEVILKKKITGLRSNRNERWKRVVTSAGADIIQGSRTEKMDAYLLSESSLFVWEDRILLITCGKTQLIHAVPEIIRIVGKQNVAFVFYERKNLLYPNEQPSDFEIETAALLEHFPGESLLLGPPDDDHIHIFYCACDGTGREVDTTLELLMTEPAPDVMDLFTGKNAANANDAYTRSGMEAIYPDMAYDHYLFSPEGYSLNGMAGACYYTIHVTPCPDGAYVSFETNVQEENHALTIDTVLSIFRPRKFSVAFTYSLATAGHPDVRISPLVADGYRATEKSVHAFDIGYGVLFMNQVLEEEVEV